MASFLKKLWKNEYSQGGIYITIAFSIVHVFNYLFNFLIGRSLGPKDYGEIASLFSYIAIFSAPISVLSTLVTQKLGSKEENRFAYAKSLENWFIEKIKKYYLILIPALILMPFLPRLTNLSTLTAYVLIPLIIVYFIATFYSATLQGLRLFFLFSAVGVIATLFKLFGAVLTTIGMDGLSTIIIFICVSSLIMLFGNYAVLQHILKIIKPVKLPQINKRLLHVVSDPYFYLILFSSLAIILFNNFDIIFVKKFFNATDAGIYSSWTLFAKIIFYLIGPLTTITFVFFTSSKNIGQQNKTLVLSLLFLSVVGITSFIFYRLFGSFIIRIVFGSKFNAVIPYLSFTNSWQICGKPSSSMVFLLPKRVTLR